MPSVIIFAVSLLFVAAVSPSAEPSDLPNIGRAPEFTLVSHQGAEVSLQSFVGKVVAVTFIYTACADVCPILTETMARVQDNLGDSFARDVAFVSITLDPERDTPSVLRAYAAAFEADLTGWHFLTGDLEAIREVARRYGMVTLPGAGAAIDHNLMTTLVDRQGYMRVRYLGHRFDPAEMEQDLRALMVER